MTILVWGFGYYYRKKEKSISKNIIAAFISSKEAGQFHGINIIRPLDICQYQYDKLYIMVGPKAFFEILEELKTVNFQEWDKVVIGWNIEPYTEEENLLLEDGRFQCDPSGICRYYSTFGQMEVKSNDEWFHIKQKVLRNKKQNKLSSIPLVPISNVFGFDRGKPIDRYYIEEFLAENSCFIQGVVLEVADREYTKRFGSDVKKSIITHIDDSCDNDSCLINLETGEGVKEGIADCFILTQTLPFIFDIRAAADNVIKILKNGGIALVTVSGISQISRYDMDRWGHYWAFTTASIKRLFEDCKDVEYVKVKAYGNVKSASAGLYGLSVEDMKQEELMYHDDNYQQVITAVVRKITK